MTSSLGYRARPSPPAWRLIFGEAFQEPVVDDGVSGMWRSFATGSASGVFGLADPFKGTRSQHLSYVTGTGSVGVENRGLNRQGL